jgi:TonB family protein
VRISSVSRAWFAWLCAAALGGCVTVRHTPPPEPPSPFDDSSASFTVHGARFAPGETAIVKVCVTPDGSIASADVVGSSGDRRFDEFALVWARQVRLKSQPPGAQPQPLCGPVRVEIRPAGVPGVFAEHSSALS